MLTDEYRYKILKLLAANPQISQHYFAGESGFNLGSVNICLKAFIQAWV